MKTRQKTVLGVAGVIGMVVGIIGAIPALFQYNYNMAILSIILLIGGLVLLAVALGD
ncbi:MAG TPA: hypothetical protein VJG90_06715 [Candidatus Nanoarchaeia archaeon]|nr:hypothetical protein [Candidatus Nanoarchaeia archaeon]